MSLKARIRTGVILRRVSRVRNAVVALVVLALSVPAFSAGVAIAASGQSGPSAGDQQYIDPLAGTTPSSGGSSSTPKKHKSPAAASAPAPAPVATPAPAAGTTLASSSSSTSSSSSSASAGAASASPATLPRTGFPAGLALALGIGLLALGAAIRAWVHSPGCASASQRQSWH
jgi:hypothetical protein